MPADAVGPFGPPEHLAPPFPERPALPDKLPFAPGTTVAVFTAQMNVDYVPLHTLEPLLPGTMSELMVDILYPAGDAIFYIETRTPTNSE